MRVIEPKPPDYPPDWMETLADPGNFLEWRSEYETAAGPTKFRCGFILHFEQGRPLSTEVQVYEKTPQVWVGERWAFSRHRIGFGKVRDIRFVAPTVKDRLDLLDALNGLL